MRDGETLTNIASNYHTNAAFLQRVNGLKNHSILPEQGLLVPLYLHQTYTNPLPTLPNGSEEQIADAQNITAPEDPGAESNSIKMNSSENQPVTTDTPIHSDSPVQPAQPHPGGNLKQLLGKIYGTPKDK